ncbi:DUF1800 family protein [Methylocucumis oryzae]|uniref:DUF1800 family protein n=1 Tax=Methylocucumis oryzae TaxID=1632867 RepID=UPI00069717F0|nr:DUF1800 family protein [Methylocucumis oryzae]
MISDKAQYLLKHHNPIRESLFSIMLTLAFALILSAYAYADQGKLTNLVVANLSPAFNPNIKQYTIPKTANCSVPVTATLADTSLKLYVANSQTISGATRNAWVCDGATKIDVVIYQNWTEVDRYTITPVQQQPLPPPPPPIDGKLTSLTVAGLSPAFDPNITEYTVAQPANCALPVTATVANPTNPNLKLYIASNPTSSGATVNAWVCDGHTSVDIVIYDVWNEVGHYTITTTGMMPDPNPGTPGDNNSGNNNGSNNNTTEANPSAEPNPALPALPVPASVSQAEALRFLEHASFGPTPALIAEVQAVGPAYWMAQQANLPKTTIDDALDINQLFSHQFLQMHNGQDQLRQRMVFALSQIIVVSANKNIYGNELIPYVRLLYKHAFGNYRSLLRDISLSPAMGKYLDLANSIKATANTSPNENYARELMQLFTIGLTQLNQDGSVKLDNQGQTIPTYDQNSLREVARALTGWTYPTQPGQTANSTNQEYFVGLMEPRPQNHDTGAKNLLSGAVAPAGQSLSDDLDSVIDNLFQHPNIAPFIATRLIRALVTDNPSPGYIQRVADVFVDNGQGVRGDLWAVANAIMTDVEATSAPTADSGRLKDPLLHVISMGRALNASVTDPNMFMYIFRNLGQQVLTPQTVFGFYSPLAPLPGHPELYGPEFQIYSPGLAIERANFIYQILSGQLGGSFSINTSAYLAVANNANALAELVNQQLMFGRMSNELKQIIVNVTNTTQGDSNRVLGALYLAAISSEFSVQY